MNELVMKSIFFGIFRWIHLACVVVAIGGTFLLRYAVLPALMQEDPERQKAIHGNLRKKLAIIVPTAIGLIILSGIVNLIWAFTTPPHPSVTYMFVLTLKLTGAMTLFCFALMLVIPSDPPNSFQKNRKRWLTMNCHLGFLLIALSVALKFLSGR